MRNRISWLGTALTALVAGAVAMWLGWRPVPEAPGPQPLPKATPVAPSPAVERAPRRGAEPTQTPKPQAAESPPLESASDAALIEILEALVDASDGCSYDRFGAYVDVEEIDPALAARAILAHEIDPAEADYVRRSMEDAARMLQELLEFEGCWPSTHTDAPG